MWIFNCVEILCQKNCTCTNLKWFFSKWRAREIIFVVQIFKMMLKTSGTLTANAKLKYLRSLLCGESLYEFNYLCIQIGSVIVTHLNQVVLGLGLYLFMPICCRNKNLQCAAE